MRRRRPAGALLAGWVLLLLGPYAVFSLITGSDLREVYLPLEDFYREELRAGRFPLWDPETAFGFPVFASAQIGFFYPPLFLLRFLPPEPAVAILLLAHGVFLACGMFRYARTLSFSPAAALLAAIAFSGSGFTVGHLVHLNITFALAWLPWALLLTDRYAASLAPRRALQLTLVLAVSALAGHFQTTFLTSLLCAARLLFGIRRTFRESPRAHTLWVAFLSLMPVAVGVLLLTAVQLLPALELFQASSRGSAGEFNAASAQQHSFPPWQTISFLLPAFFGFPDLSEYWGVSLLFEVAAWVGAFPILLAIVGAIWSGPRRETSDNPLFWTITALIGFLLALGRWSPLTQIGLDATLGVFSAPARFLLYPHLGLALLAGYGLDTLRTARAPPRATRRLGAAALATVLLAGALSLFIRSRPDLVAAAAQGTAQRFVLSRPEHILEPEAVRVKIAYLIERVSTWGVNFANPFVLVSVASLGAGGAALVLRLRGPFLPLAAGFVTAFELAVIAWQIHPRFPWGAVVDEPEIVRTIREHPEGRLLVVRPPDRTGLLFGNRTTADRGAHERLHVALASPNLHTRYGIAGTDWPAALDLAASGAVLERARDPLGRPRNDEILDRLSVRYVAASTATPDVALSPPARVLATPPTLEEHRLTVWERPTARPRVEVLSELPADITVPLPASAGRATLVAETPQSLMITAENQGPREAFLVLRDSYFKGWRARLDGRAVPVERAETLFRAVRLPSGSHRVDFFYAPLPFRLGSLISATAWLAGLALLTRKKTRRLSGLRATTDTPLPT